MKAPVEVPDPMQDFDDERNVAEKFVGRGSALGMKSQPRFKVRLADCVERARYYFRRENRSGRRAGTCFLGL